MIKKFSDTDLVRRLKNNDTKAFELIFLRYKEKLYFFTLGYLRSISDTEEIIQNVFVSLWENRAILNEKYCLKSFIYKITVNQVFNLLKHRIVRQKFIDHITQQAEEDNYSEESIISNDLQNHIEAIIGELPKQQQSIYRLSRHSGLSNAEIARDLGISVRSVENQIYRALKYIKEKLKQESFINE